MSINGGSVFGGKPVAGAPNVMVVGVDFGTTFSGISYGLTAKPEEIFTITDWPGMGNRSFEKVPTEITYIVPKGSTEKFLWGFKAQKDANRLRWFKLLLNPSSQTLDLNNQVATYNAAMPNNMQAVDVVRDYISGLMAHFESEIKRKYGPSFFETMSKRYIFTVPALWSDIAKALTYKAIKASGFVKARDDVRLVPEPEAAALCCLRQIQACTVKAGNTIIVADCGGGTADVISYKVKKIEPMEVVEAAVGEGDLCGSVYVDIQFEEFIKGRLGNTFFGALSAKQKETLKKGFGQEVKCNFGNDPTETVFSFGVPGFEDTPCCTIEDGYLELTREEIVTVFRPVLKRTTRLINRQKVQIENAGGSVSALLLVGGFGGSAYLLKHFKDWAEQHGSIVVLQPPNGWSAIGRGAVYHGFENGTNMVTSRIARSYYGVKFQEPFVRGEHDFKYRFFDPLHSAFYCSTRVKWFMQKGDEISESKPIDHAFSRTVWEADFKNYTGNRVFKDVLLGYDGEYPPPKYSDDPSIRVIGEMSSDLRQAPNDCWQQKNFGTDEDVMSISFNLRMTLRSGQLDFELRAKERCYGNTKIVFDEGA